MGLRDTLDKLKHGDISLPRLTRIPDGQVLVEGYDATPFEAGRHYLTVRVNSVGLRHNRQWFSTWQPMVIAVTEFRYGTQEVSIPTVIGPAMLRERVSAEIPFATVFAATRVAGPHPYRGDRVVVTVLLYQVKRDDYIRQVLGVVEKLASALDYATMLAPFLKLKDAAISGIDAVLGHKDTAQILAHRMEWDPNAGDVFRPGHYAVLGTSAPDPKGLWVHPDHVLRTGPDTTAAEPVRDDLVLYSVTSTSTRNDVDSLPWVQPLLQRVHRAANTPNDEGKTAAKAHLAILLEQLRESPDITRTHADALYREYDLEARSVHDLALGRKTWGPTDLANTGDDLQRDFLSVLNGEW